MYPMNELSLPKHSNVKQTQYKNSWGLSLAGKQNKNRGQIVYLLSPLVSFDNTERHRCHIKPTSHNNGTTSSLITKKQENFWYLIAKDSTLSLKSHILYA